jgi:hypothetical protein
LVVFAAAVFLAAALAFGLVVLEDVTAAFLAAGFLVLAAFTTPTALTGEVKTFSALGVGEEVHCQAPLIKDHACPSSASP